MTDSVRTNSTIIDTCIDRIDYDGLRIPDVDARPDRIVRRQRDGVLNEAKDLVAQLLRDSGFDITVVTAHWPASDGEPAPISDDLVRTVLCPSQPGRRLVDVASGHNTPPPAPVGTARPAVPAGAGRARALQHLS